MDKEDFLEYSMQLLWVYIEQDKQTAKDTLEQLGVKSDEIESVLYTIHDMSLGYI